MHRQAALYSGSRDVLWVLRQIQLDEQEQLRTAEAMACQTIGSSSACPVDLLQHMTRRHVFSGSGKSGVAILLGP